MYCPRCGQARISDRTSFCSRCGLYLDHIEEVVGNDGDPVYIPPQSGGASILTGRNIRLFSLFWFLVVTVILTPASAILGARTGLTAILGLLGPVGALVMLIFSFFVPTPARLKLRKRRGDPTARQFQEAAERKGLPPEQTVFAEDFVPPRSQRPEPASGGRRGAPPSVTEETTRHLKRNDEE